MTRPQLWSIPALAVAFVCSCSSTPRGSQNRYEGSQGQASIHSTEGNQVLANSLDILDPRTRATGDGRMQVQFDLANRRSSAIEFAWAVDWFGADGFQISDSSRRWEPLAIGGHGKHVLTIVAPRPEAVQWRLQVTSRDEVH